MRRLSIRLWAAFALASVVTYGLEVTSERALERAGGDQSLLGQSVFGMSHVYQYIVATGPRTPVPRYTALVVIDTAMDPAAVGLLNVCEQRAFLADLLRRIADAAPTVIVVDKFFDASTRCDEGVGTTLLQGMVHELTVRRIPVVLGSLIDEQPISNGSRLPDGKRPTRFVVHKGLAFPDTDSSLLAFGAVNLSPDTRKVPLQWSAYSTDGDVAVGAQPVTLPTLALQAARSFDPNLIDKYPRLRRLLAARVHPYTSFIDAPAFVTLRAGDVLCGTNAGDGHHWRDCVDAPSDPDVLHLLHGRIVIVGEQRRDMDIHSSVLGPVPGFLLQANYVEALLDDRYLEPVSRWVDYAYGFLLFAGVQLAMLVYQRSVLKALFWASACFAVAVFVLYALVVHVGWYVNPVSVSVLAVAIYGSHLVFERLISLGGERP